MDVLCGVPHACGYLCPPLKVKKFDPTIKAEMDDESAHALTTGSRIASRSATRAARLNLTTMGEHF
jgi:hypothetical protein